MLVKQLADPIVVYYRRLDATPAKVRLEALLREADGVV